MHRWRPARDATAIVLLFLLLGLGVTGSAQAAALPALSVNDVALTETTGSPATATFTVTLSGPSADPVTVQYATVNSGATAPTDYTSAGGTLVFAPGETTKDVPVTVVGDAVDEDDETFSLQLSSPANATITDGIGVATITDDDPPPSWSVGDASVIEGTGANKFLVFTVTLSAPSSRFTAVDYETLEGTAKEILSVGTTTTGDYTKKTGTLSFSPGTTSQQVSVSIRADAEDETDETLTLHLKDTSGGIAANTTIADADATGTIIDDDGPSVSINDVTVPAEGATGTKTPAVFTVTLTAPSPQPVTVSFASANDSALSGQDYTALAAGLTLTIPAGQTTGTIATEVLGDDLDENDEKYRVTLTNPVNATLGDGVGVATITDDDEAPTVLVSPVTVVEGTGGTTNAVLTVTLSAPSGRTILAGYATKDATAVAGVDYQQAAELLTYNPGETSKTVSIPIAPDSEIEQDETFELYVFNAASNGDDILPVLVTITDDDLNDGNKPQLSVDDVTVPLEGDLGTTKQAVFTVSMDRTLARPVTVSFGTEPGTATVPDDYAPVAGTLTFAPGERTKQITVTTIGDDLVEFNQDFRVKLANPVNAKLLDASGLGIITDDDAGGGRLVIGLQAAPLPLEKLKLRDLLCAKGTAKKPAKCAGLRVGWAVANTGRIDVTVLAVQPRGKAKVAPTFRLLTASRGLPKPGSKGSLHAKLTAGKATEALVKRVRDKKVVLLRVTLTFTNSFGGQQAVTETIRLTR